MTLDRAERLHRGQLILGFVQGYVTLHEVHSSDQPRSWELLLRARAELNALVEQERRDGGDAWISFVAKRPA